jgi:hypothetical protein
MRNIFAKDRKKNNDLEKSYAKKRKKGFLVPIFVAAQVIFVQVLAN